MSKSQLSSFVRYGKLFEIYGGLLSDDRQEVMRDYFFNNMTLAEIAKDRKISRQAVSDAVDKSCQKLDEFEKILAVYEKNESVRQELETLKEKVENILRKI